MQEEQTAFLKYLEENPDAPAPTRDSILTSLGRNVIYLSDQEIARYKLLLSAREQERKAA